VSTAVLANHRRTLATLAITLVAAASVAAVLASSGHARTTATTKPTIVLVHGGWADASGWNAEVTNLEKLGYPVIAPANPLRGLASDADYLHSVLSTINGPIVLVGHSYGGAVISNAAVGLSNVKALVFVAGWAPDKGESLLGLIAKYPGTMIGPKTTFVRRYSLGDGTTGGDLYLTKKGFETAFASDVPKKQADLMWAEQRPFSQEAFGSPSAEPAWKTIPSWYLVSTEDHAIPPATQMFMAKRAHAKIEKVKASHVLMISQPAATTKIILEAAKAAS
jgi:pimeloyl-ACP methyl ester carboxylesterase